MTLDDNCLEQEIPASFCKLAWTLACLLVAAPLSAQEPIVRPLRLWYDKPAVAWEQALPIGNGKTGAMVFGGVETEKYLLNDNTLWSGFPEPGNNPAAAKFLPLVRKAITDGDYGLAEIYWKKMQGPYSARYLPMGSLLLQFPGRPPASDYARSLDLHTAIATVTHTSGGVKFLRESFASHPDGVLVVRLTASKKKQVSFGVKLSSKLKHSTIPLANDYLVLRGKAPMYVAHRSSDPVQVAYDDSEKGEGMTFEIHLRIRSEGGSILRTDSSLQVKDAHAATLYLSEATSFDGFKKSPGTQGKDPTMLAAADLAAAVSKPYDELRNRHIDDYQKLFHRVKLDLGFEPGVAALPTDKRLVLNQGKPDLHLQSLYYQFGRYLLISCSRPGAPPANLQGMWNDHVQPPWGSNYTININTEMNYWLAESTNLSECHQPLLDFIGQLSENGARTALENYGITSGWCAHHNSDIWAKTSPVGGYEADPSSQARWSCWPMGGAWLSLHLWDHYLFTGNQEFLKSSWPFMKGAAQFLLNWMTRDSNGNLVTIPSTSPENVFRIEGKEYQLSMASTMDMAISRELFSACLLAAGQMEGESAFKNELEAALERLYPYHIGKHGQLQEWFLDWDDPNDKHRHLSHLFGLHPGTHISPTGTPQLASAAKQSLIHRGDVSTGWSMAWKINWWARLYEGDHAMKILQSGLSLIDPVARKEVMGGGGTYPNLFDAHPPFQIDGNFGATAGMTEMLVQSHEGEISLLPALPGEWSSGSVNGLRTRGGFEIDISWSDGLVSRAVIYSSLGGNCRIRSRQPLRVVEAPSADVEGLNPNPLMQAPMKPKINGSPPSQAPGLEPAGPHRLDFQTTSGGRYTLVPR